MASLTQDGLSQRMMADNDGINSNTPKQYYNKDKENFQKFVSEYTIDIRNENTTIDSDDDDDDDMAIPTGEDNINVRRISIYQELIQRIKDRNYYSDIVKKTFIVEVPLTELIQWDAIKGGDLAQKASNNTMRYQSIFSTVFDELIESTQLSEQAQPALDTIDVLHDQRLDQQQRNQQQQQERNNNTQGINNIYARQGAIEDEEENQNNNNNRNNDIEASEEFPPQLMRRYELRILPIGRRGTHPPFHNQYIRKPEPIPVALSLRHVRAKNMGHIVTVSGMIVRTSDVKPFCVVATYSCDHCGAEIYQPISKREFLPASKCPACANKRSILHLQTRGSKFVKFQELKVQELPHQVPMGHVPRSVSVLCRGELTRMATPGDVVTVDGVFLPQKLAESGFKAMKAGLIATTYIEAQNIVVHKKSYDETAENLPNDIDEQVLRIATGNDPVGKLASSIAPEIFGHDDIKRALLLQLVGGCTRTLPDGMRIRGDVNICLMGDPANGKSQLLKHIASIAPRGVYTTGKGSSGVGLTAAVTKDMTTGEMALEGGALVLADRGICCIDEFDKMDEADRTAIHEVMEQQTVSIAKAGIVATLNARTSVLAAANPLYGRYNRRKSLSENINLPNSLLSRFDLKFLIIDIAVVDNDMALACHVTWVHKNEGLKKNNDDDDDNEIGEDDNAEDDERNVVLPQVLREYISQTRCHQPVMPPEVAPYVVEVYVSLRMQDNKHNNRSSKESNQTAMTARQLLSILRLSQALSRLRFSDFVVREDVDEAIQLLTHIYA